MHNSIGNLFLFETSGLSELKECELSRVIEVIVL